MTPVTIPLTRGKIAIVNSNAPEWVFRSKWHANEVRPGVFYARRGDNKYLHKLLCPEARQVDHKDGNTLDCRRQNLRPANNQENNCNKPKTASESTSPFKGVSWHSKRGKWRAYIAPNGKQISLGYHDTEEAAARAYDAAARRHFGEFARLNFP